MQACWIIWLNLICQLLLIYLRLNLDSILSEEAVWLSQLLESPNSFYKHLNTELPKGSNLCCGISQEPDVF